MKRAISALLAILLVVAFWTSSFASDWDVAGKVLTGIEGMRVLTRGKIDIIGNIAGIRRDERQPVYEERHPKIYVYRDSCRRVWVPHFVWKRKWIPAHKGHDEKSREIFVGGHYIRYKVEKGGHWVYDCPAKRRRH